MAEKKKGKKKWYEVLASKHFNNIPVGESVAYEDKGLIGRVMKVNLGTLTRDAKLQNVRIKFKINEIKDEKAYTEVKGYELSGSYVKRIMRAVISKIDDSFIITTKEGIKLKLKPLVLTKHKAQKNVLKGLRGLIRKEINDYIKNEVYDKFISDLISKKIQRDIRNKLSKIYPVGVVEIRMMERI